MKLIACGDSNLTNAYTSSPNLVYSALIASFLGREHVSLAVSGKKSHEIAAQVDAAILAGANEIIIGGPTNNFSQNLTGNSETIIDEIVDDYGGMITACHAVGVKPIIFSPILPNDASQYAKHIECAKRLSILCAQRLVDYVPLTEHMNAAFLNGAKTWTHTPDGWHGYSDWHALAASLFINRQYGSESTPPPSPVILLDVAALTDSSSFGRTVSVVGNVFLDSGVPRYDGAGDLVSLADSDDWAFGSKNLSIKMRVKWNALGGFLMCQRSGVSDYTLLYNNGTTTYYQIVTTAGGVTGVPFAWSPSVGVAYDIELRRAGNMLSFWVNGSQIGSTVAISTAVPNFGAPLIFGGDAFSGTGYFNGWISNISIIRG